MNSEQVKGLLERGVYIGLMWLVGKGIIPEGLVDDIVMVVITIVGIFLGWKQNTQSSLVSAAAKQPDVKRVVVTGSSDLAKETSAGATISTS